MNAQKSFVLERVRFSVGVAAMRHHAARRARALAGSVLRARGVAAGLVRSPEARGSACLPAPSPSSSRPAGLPRSPFAAWTHAARPAFPGASTRRWSSVASAAASPDPNPPAAPPPTRGRLRQMRVAELRAACAARGLEDRGRKEELVSRLEDASSGDGRASSPEHGDPTSSLERHDATEPSRLDSSAETQTALDDTGVASSSRSSSFSLKKKTSPRARALAPNEHGIDPNAIPPYVRTLQRRLASGDHDDLVEDDFEEGDFTDDVSRKSPTRKRYQKHRLFVVGGAARDLFLGKTPRDFDLLTDASWSVVKRRARPCVVVGRRFKVAHCFEETGDTSRASRGKRTGAFYELVSMRDEEADEEMEGASRETELGFADEGETEKKNTRSPRADVRSRLSARVARRLRADASRRDFTVNALAYDVESGFLYDFVGAIEDIESRVVRTVRASAAASFQEDPARMLRAVRVAARHDFVLAGSVVSALKACAHLLRKEHPARLAGELRALLTRGFSEKAVVSLWATGALEHVAHLHATHVARATDPGTNFVAAPPGAFTFAADESALSEDDDDDRHHALLPPDVPWRRAAAGDEIAAGRDAARRAGSALTRHRRGGKRVSDATLARVVRQDPLFRVLRALDSRVRRSGDKNGGSCSETLAMACLAAPFAVKKLGWPSLEPEAPEEAEKKKTSGGAPEAPSAVRRFASARFTARLAAFAASRSADERRAWRAAAERRGGGEDASSPKKKKRRSRDLSPETLWRRSFAAWTEEAGHAARVMQADYHLSAKHVMASALVTMHAPFLRAAPAADVLRRRAEMARARRPGKGKSGKDVDFSATAKSATFSFPAGANASSVADEKLTRVLRLLAGGDEKSRRASSRRAGRRRGAGAGAGVGVAALPGELLAFAEILCDAALDGTADDDDDADAVAVVGDDDEDSDAARYEVGDDDFDPDEPL